MLIEGAVRFAHMGRDGLARRDFEQWYNGLSQCQAILLELMSGLRPEIAPELCSRLNALYTFMYRRMLDASSAKDPAIVDEVIELLEYDRDSWKLLMEKIDAERSGDQARIDDVLRRAAQQKTKVSNAAVAEPAPSVDSAGDDHTARSTTPAAVPAAPPLIPASMPRSRFGQAGVYAPPPSVYRPAGPRLQPSSHPIAHQSGARPSPLASASAAGATGDRDDLGGISIQG